MGLEPFSSRLLKVKAPVLIDSPLLLVSEPVDVEVEGLAQKAQAEAPRDRLGSVLSHHYCVYFVAPPAESDREEPSVEFANTFYHAFAALTFGIALALSYIFCEDADVLLQILLNLLNLGYFELLKLDLARVMANFPHLKGVSDFLHI